MPITTEQLEAVNTEINAIPYSSDTSRHGVADYWDSADAVGADCEDYAIAKLRKLLALGCEKSRLKVGLCYVETGEYHAVLIATVDGTDYVLDNRHPHVMEWNLLPYRWDRFYLLGERKWRAAA